MFLPLYHLGFNHGSTTMMNVTQNKETITELGPYRMVVSGGGAGVPVGQQGQCLERKLDIKWGRTKASWNPKGQTGTHEGKRLCSSVHCLPPWWHRGYTEGAYTVGHILLHELSLRLEEPEGKYIVRVGGEGTQLLSQADDMSWQGSDQIYTMLGIVLSICFGWPIINQPSYISSPTLPWEPTVVDFTQVLSELIMDTLTRGWKDRTGRARFRRRVNRSNFRRGWSEDGEKMYHFRGIRE